MRRRLEPVRGSEDTAREAQPPGRATDATTPTTERHKRVARAERNERDTRGNRQARRTEEAGQAREARHSEGVGNPSDTEDIGNTSATGDAGNSSDSGRTGHTGHAHGAARDGGEAAAPATPAAPTAPSSGATRPQPSSGAGGAEQRPASASSTDAARERLALAQTALLSALVAGTPAPEGFDRGRLRVQSRALTAKRAAVVAKVAPELPEILGEAYRPAFLGYARYRPLRGGYRQDALDFAAHLLAQGRPEDPAARQQLTRWWCDRAGSRPPSARPVARLARAVRRVLHRL